ncbi:MAG: 4'-phosphopantetheinyl transferase superfamily protein [Polyangiales bacterium]
MPRLELWLHPLASPLPLPTRSALLALLPARERARHAAFRHEGGADEFLCGRAMLRALRSADAPVDPRAWVMGENRYGRPWIVGPPAGRLRWGNVSHTRGMVAVLLSDIEAAGVDVERVARRVSPREIAHRYFSVPEREALMALDDEGARSRFFDLWTLKEAFIKAKGMGLAIPLGDFSFDPAREPVQVRFAPTLDEDPGRWWFHRSDPTPEHRVALAARAEGRPVELVVRRLDDLTPLTQGNPRVAVEAATVLSTP